jgi:hypothetical protein
LLAATASDREPSLQVAAVVDTLHEIAGPQAGAARWPAGTGHTAGGALPAPPGHRQPAAGNWYADHSRCAGAGVHRQPEGPSSPGAGLQHLL